MGAAELISLAITGITQLTKVVVAANSGDLDTAKQNLAAARAHFDNALAKWYSTKAP